MTLEIDTKARMMVMTLAKSKALIRLCTDRAIREFIELRELLVLYAKIRPK